MSMPSPWPTILRGTYGSTPTSSVSSRRTPGLPDATTASPQNITLPNGGTISTVFVFQSPSSQNAANTVYTAVSTTNATYLANGTNYKYNFKTDYERMQYLQGRFARARGTSGY